MKYCCRKGKLLQMYFLQSMEAFTNITWMMRSLLAIELKNYTTAIRLVARNPKPINSTDQLVKADLLDAAAVSRAVEGSNVIYLCVGLEYKLSVWQQQWPVIMQNCIEACVLHNARLVFLDNVYMYSKNNISHMTESALLDPPSSKGIVRLQIANMLLAAVKEQSLKALIARSADFYGPGVNTSMLKISVLDNFKKGKKAMWMMDATRIHSFTNTPDITKAIALLGNTLDAFGQVWHLPTSSEKITGLNFIELIAAAMNVKPRYYTLSIRMLSILGLFMPMLRELKEMQYQNGRDYFFDSSLCERRFNIHPTSYAAGIEAIINKAGH